MRIFDECLHEKETSLCYPKEHDTVYYVLYVIGVGLRPYGPPSCTFLSSSVFVCYENVFRNLPEYVVKYYCCLF